MKRFLALLAIVTCVFDSSAQLRLPAVISSSMVLQQKDSATLWGWAGPASKVYVTTGWNGRTDSTTTDNGAQWRLKVMTPAAGGPYDITIKSDTTIVLKDVLIGEVWVCSGQSNMEMSYSWGEKSVGEELPTAYHKNIRFFQVPKTTSQFPQDDVKAQWTVCDSNTIKTFSAVGYFFGKRLNKELNVPIGLINSSWGGTPAEVWTPVEYIEKDPVLKEAADKLSVYNWWPNITGRTFNAMIYPITQFNIAGAIWYQGEANTGTNSTYAKLLTTMIDSWRDAWKKDLPFYYVQIAPFDYGEGNKGALLEEAQTKAMKHPNVGMAVITDLVDSVTNIHPSHKKEVGNRLAGWALAETYKKPGLNYKSPMFKNAEIEKGKIVLTFDNAPNGLKATSKNAEGFYIAGENGQWEPAKAKIEKDKVTVSNKKIREPKYVRFGFSNTLIGNVFSAEGLPLTPFRTDSFAQ
jgi:sialate O-acetylesterase